jgi:hypothetical protein
MEEMTWDQLALVDYEILIRSNVFGGTWESSFAWNIAVRRHEVQGGELKKSKHVMYTDNRSTLSGPGEDDVG